MPYPNINTNNSASSRSGSRQTVRWNTNKISGTGVTRNMFLGLNYNESFRIENRYILGSGVGSKNISVRRNLERRALENGKCCIPTSQV